jgi:hypothetical protein
MGGLVAGGLGVGGLVAAGDGLGDQVGCGLRDSVLVEHAEQGFDAREAFLEEVAGSDAEAGVEFSGAQGGAVQDQVHGTTVIVVEADTHCIFPNDLRIGDAIVAGAWIVFPYRFSRFDG